MAHYLLLVQGEGHVQANLIRYDGRIDQKPPDQFHLLKYEHSWSATIPEVKLVKDLGAVLDKKLSLGLFQPLKDAATLLCLACCSMDPFSTVFC